MKKYIIISLFVGLFIFYFIGCEMVFNKFSLNFNIFVNDFNFILDFLLYIFVFVGLPLLIGGKRAFRLYFTILLIIDIILVFLLLGSVT